MKSGSEVCKSQVLPLNPFCSWEWHCTLLQWLSVMSSDALHILASSNVISVSISTVLPGKCSWSLQALTSDLSIWFNTAYLQQDNIAPLTFLVKEISWVQEISPASSARTTNAKQSLSLCAIALVISSRPFIPLLSNCPSESLLHFFLCFFNIFYSVWKLFTRHFQIPFYFF